MADPYEQAFAALGTALVDLDGDGVPDVAVPATTADIRNRMPDSGQSRYDRQRKGQQYAMRGRDIPAQYQPTSEDQAQAAEYSGNMGDLGMQAAMTVAPVGRAASLASAGVRAMGAPALAAGGYLLGSSSVADAQADAPQIDYKTIFIQPPQAPQRVTPDSIGNDEVDAYIKGKGGVQAVQRELGLSTDGKAGDGTRMAIRRALADQRSRQLQTEFETQQQTWGERNSAAKLKYEADLANKPFLERNAWYKDYVVPGTYVAAAALPAAVQAGVNYAGKTGARSAARAVDDAVGNFGKSQTPANALIAGQAAKNFEAASAPAAAPTNSLLQSILPTGATGIGAALPTLGAGLPIAWDYQLAPKGSEARNYAEGELTVENMVRRFLGPGVTGLGLAALGRGAGEAAGNIFFNPQPRGDALARAQTLGGMAGDRAAMQNALMPVEVPRAGIMQRVEDAVMGSPAYRARRADDALTAQEVAAVAQQERLASAEALRRSSANTGSVQAPAIQPPAAASPMPTTPQAPAQQPAAAPPAQPPALPPPPASSGPNQQPLPTSARLQFQNDVAEVLRSNLGADATFVRNLAARPDYYARVIPSMLRNRAATPEEQADALQMIQAIVASAAPRNALLP